jgi:hypothetical protein
MLLTACGARQAGDADDGDPPPLGPADWSACAARGEYENCAEACVAEGMTCVANGCPAVLEFCDPEPCDMATQAIAIGEGLFCTDASVGGFVAAECDAPIQYILNNTSRCCCAEEI